MTVRLTGRVALSAAFLGLAAGGTAACDSAPNTEENHTFYCANGAGVVVDEDNCDDDGDGHGGAFFLYHSTAYPHGLRPGQKVPAGGQRFAYSDKSARTAWGLPATGRIGNGSSVKVGVAGRGGAPVRGGGGG